MYSSQKVRMELGELENTFEELEIGPYSAPKYDNNPRRQGAERFAILKRMNR